MKSVNLRSDPIMILRHACFDTASKMLEDFLEKMRHLYQYDIFKTMLDLTTTKALQGLLSFRLYNQRFFDMDEGNCKTIFGEAENQSQNRNSKQNIYQITIKKISYDVIIHEIAHMVEKECAVDLELFAQCVIKDIAKLYTSVNLQQVVAKVMVREVQAYSEDQRYAEFFARYFQILCMSKEIMGHNSDNSYALSSVLEHFNNTTDWVYQECYPKINTVVDSEIAIQSSNFTKQIQNIQHKWSEQKAHSLHQKYAKKWQSVVNSIKSDPLK